MPHINNTDTTQSGAKWISPRTRRTAAPHSDAAAASMAFMLRTAVFLFDGRGYGRGYLKTIGEDR